MKSLAEIRKSYRSFLFECATEPNQFRLTPNSEISPYALCFAIFGFQLLRDNETIQQHRDIWAKQILQNLSSAFQSAFSCNIATSRNKPLMQLLTFSLSALSICRPDKLTDLAFVAQPLIEKDQKKFLSSIGVDQGVPGTGNLAMFQAILLFYAKLHLGLSVEEKIEAWLDFHFEHLNQNGFWGPVKSSPYLQFQNGYHQYEILEYASRIPKRSESATLLVEKISSFEGHFAPYPGGGGCYDYDAAFLLTLPGLPSSPGRDSILRHTFNAIVNEQNPDGGYAESIVARTRNPLHLGRVVSHIWGVSSVARTERLKKTLSVLIKPSKSRIHTHWTNYSRKWDESDLWDSWFRMLTLARIQAHLEPTKQNDWGFLTFPGIGFHHLNRESIAPNGP